jgi:hypothetical protein
MKMARLRLKSRKILKRRLAFDKASVNVEVFAVGECIRLYLEAILDYNTRIAPCVPYLTHCLYYGEVHGEKCVQRLGWDGKGVEVFKDAWTPTH